MASAASPEGLITRHGDFYHRNSSRVLFPS